MHSKIKYSLFVFLIAVVGCNNSMKELRFVEINEPIEYTRHEHRLEPVNVKENLLSFVYDIPYFGACGVFPPIQVINQRFAYGGGDGGMGPGTSWDPFQIDQKAYSELVQLIRQTDPKTLKEKSRYYFIKFIEAPEFDAIQDQWEWVSVVCEKYRERYHEENAKIQDV